MHTFLEMGAYEYLWDLGIHSFSSIAKLKGPLLDHVPRERAKEYAKLVEARSTNHQVVAKDTSFYPERLLSVPNALKLFYYRGELNLSLNPTCAVVGSRKITIKDEQNTKELVEAHVREGFTIVSGLARGIDTVALKTAIDLGGKVIGVIGTSIDKTYPPENKDLQEEIAKNHLLISQIPFIFDITNPSKRFLERNVTIMALSDVSNIITMSPRSGSFSYFNTAIALSKHVVVHPDSKFNPVE